MLFTCIDIIIVIYLKKVTRYELCYNYSSKIEKIYQKQFLMKIYLTRMWNFEEMYTEAGEPKGEIISINTKACT